VANTRWPVHFCYAERPHVRAALENGDMVALDACTSRSAMETPLRGIEVGLPLERLRLIEVVDTPGTESAQLELDTSEVEFRTADMPVWCTVAAQAWKESERRAWARVPDALRARGVLVVTRIDQLRDATEVAALRRRLEREIDGAFVAMVFLAIPDAIAASGTARPDGATAPWRRSGGEALEDVVALAVAENANDRISKARQTLQRAVTHLSREHAIMDALPIELLPDIGKIASLGSRLAVSRRMAAGAAG
jgi:hypothetical protein